MNKLVKNLVVVDEEVTIHRAGNGLGGSVYLVDRSERRNSPNTSGTRTTKRPFMVNSTAGTEAQHAHSNPSPKVPPGEQQLLQVIARLRNELEDVEPLREEVTRLREETRRQRHKLSDSTARILEFKTAWDTEARAFSATMSKMQDFESLHGAVLSEGVESAGGQLLSTADEVSALRAKVAVLEQQLQESQMHNAKQAVLVAKWERRWTALRSSAKKRRQGQTQAATLEAPAEVDEPEDNSP